ncbi:MAG: MBOAT family protein [Clostridia bacterium]|nr:MBOAT family protein [Clostridia bacterium]
MVFSSGVFLFLFLPTAVAAYHILPARARNLFLFAASLVFYAWEEPVYVAIMLFSTVFDYVNGRLLEKEGMKQRTRKLILVLSVTVNIGLLAFFKYTNFIIDTANGIFGVSVSLIRLSLPVGISFYTFQTLSYTVDVYRGKVRAQRNIIDFGMYICMFPQLIAGPIVRYADIEDRIKDRPRDPEDAAAGIFRFVCGLSKKVLIANQFGALWDDISARAGTLPAAAAWIGALAFAFQIYFDFSGYSDMAVGIGRVLGFRLPENFRYPYEATSVTDFWRRWHITLGVWFREYVYIPLGGNKKGLPRQIFNMLVVWALTGIWHGAGWNFLLWGLFFFVLLVIEKTFLLKLLKRAPAAVGRLWTLLAVLFSWTLFACDDTGLLLRYLSDLFGANGFFSPSVLYYLSSYGAVFAVAALFSTHFPKAVAERAVGRIKNRPAAFVIKAAAALIALALSIVFVVGDAYDPFLYFRF